MSDTQAAPDYHISEPEETNYINATSGFSSWFMTIDHKRLGIMYLAAVIGFFALGGFAALAVRLELLQPNIVNEAGVMTGAIMSPEAYNRMFTLHGLIMVFLFIIPGIPAALGKPALLDLPVELRAAADARREGRRLPSPEPRELPHLRCGRGDGALDDDRRWC